MTGGGDTVATPEPAAFIVRDAELRDADEIVRCVRANNQHHRSPFAAFTREIVLRDFFGADAFMHAVVAQTGRRVIGAASWHVGYESGYAARGSYLSDIWVDPDQRRRGVGRALIGAVARRTRESGGVYVWWVAQPWNKPAQDFYVRLGASNEVVRAHALTWGSFDALADADAGQPR